LKKEKYGRVCYYGKTMKQSTFKKNEEMTALRKEHVNQISGIEKKIEDLEEMIKFLVE